MSTHSLHVSQVVEKIVGRWRGAPPVTVVSWPKDLPVRGAPSDVRGMYMSGETWVVANTQSTTRVGETLAHEALGHHAMRDMLGSGWRSFMYALNHGARSGDVKLAGMREYVKRVYVNDSGDCNLSAVQVGDEVAAAVVEYRFDGKTGRLEVEQPARKLATAAAGHFARETLYMDKPATFEELEGALLAAEHRLRFGSGFFGLGYWARRWYASATMSKPWNPKAPPMSMQESESLLKAANDRSADWNEWKIIGLLLVVAVGALIAIFGFGQIFTWVFSGFQR